MDIVRYYTMQISQTGIISTASDPTNNKENGMRRLRHTEQVAVVNTSSLGQVRRLYALCASLLSFLSCSVSSFSACSNSFLLAPFFLASSLGTSLVTPTECPKMLEDCPRSSRRPAACLDCLGPKPPRSHQTFRHLSQWGRSFWATFDLVS